MKIWIKKKTPLTYL